MSKRDRIPDEWPALMSDDMAAAYLDMSVSQFRTLVDCGKLPAGRKIFDTEMIRWRRAQLDAAINLEFGLPADNARLLASGVGDEWMDAIRAA